MSTGAGKKVVTEGWVSVVKVPACWAYADAAREETRKAVRYMMMAIC